MAIVKRTSGNLIIQTPQDSLSNITLDTSTVIVTGSLQVLGSSTLINTINTSITDNIIVLNDGESGNGVSLGSAGITVDRGGLANVTLRWEESVDRWQITTDGSTYANISTTTGANALAAVVEDPAPVLGGNLNVDGHTIYANATATSYITLQGALELKTANVTPNAAIGSTVLYASDTLAGQSGLFVVNQQVASEELITKRRAFGFSLIL
jgi:hypothetical protein